MRDKGLQSIGEILREMQTPEGQASLRETEQAFRRGYHHAWENAIDAIFAMWEQDIPRKDAYAMSAFHANRIAAWRADDTDFDMPPEFAQDALYEALKEYRMRKQDAPERTA